jgi:hypothetical protein
MKTTRVEPLPVQFGESTTPRMQTLTMEVEAFPMQFEESLPDAEILKRIGHAKNGSNGNVATCDKFQGIMPFTITFQEETSSIEDELRFLLNIERTMIYLSSKIGPLIYRPL